jgi:multidrug efflux pump subunit AcrA (membrane-fusion protein)
MGVVASALLAPPTLGDSTSAPSPASAQVPAVIVTRVSQICFSSRIRTTGYLAPRAPAAVMWNAPNFVVTEVDAHEGDMVHEGQTVAMVTPRNAPAGSPQASGIALRAPVAGLVLRSTARTGLETSAGAGPLFTIAGGGEIEALADIPSLHVAELAPGQHARVMLDDGREFGGHLRKLPVEINSATQSGQARISFEDAHSLKTGTFARVVIEASRSCGLSVPLAAITQDSGGTKVQVVKDKTIATRAVNLGMLNDIAAEVSGAIAEGDLVVANAGTSLRDGDKVRPIDSDLQEVR